MSYLSQDNHIAIDKSHPIVLKFAQKGDEEGLLVAIEGLEDVPFDIKRVFYIYGSKSGIVRGRHANENSEFVLINVAGSSTIRTVEQDGTETLFFLDEPQTGLYIPKGVWKDMYDFSDDSVLLVLASTHYDAAEYIRDFDAFLASAE